MSPEEEHKHKQHPPYHADDSLLINSRERELERQRDQDKEYQREYNGKQLGFNRSLTAFTGLLFLTSAVSDILLWQYVNLTDKSAQAATSAASTAYETLNKMTESNDSTVRQVERLISQQQRTADAMEKSLSRSKDALDASIENYKLDQRAWIGVKDLRVVSFERDKPMKLDIGWFNSGKTPGLTVTNGTKYAVNKTWVTGPTPEWSMKFALEPQQSIPPQGSFTTHISINLTGEQFDGIKSRSSVLYLYGETHYGDISKRFHAVTEFCVFVGFVEDPEKPGLYFCPNFNDMR